MRGWIVAIALLAACKSGTKDNGAVKKAAKAAATVPVVSVAIVLAKEEGKPPFLLLVDDAGAVRLAAAATWADLDANKLKVAKKAQPLHDTDMYVRESVGLGRAPLETIASWDEYAESDIDLSALEDTATRSNDLAQDDPPPPEEEDKPDDGEDESGGTGTAIALDEGKMGKKDSDRAEGQYKMKKNQDDPQLARQQAIEQARAAGILGDPASGGGVFSSLGDPRPNEDGTPSRVAQVVGVVATDGKIERMNAMIFVPPAMKATKLIELVRDTGASIAVSYAGKIRPLRLQFNVRGNGSVLSSWLEARVSLKGITVEAVPDAPIEISDPKELAAALDKARKARGTDDDAPVDVLVDPDVDTQRLVDMLVTLDTAGVRVIGMGAAPSPEQLARRGRRIPTTSLGMPNAQGDLDKTAIRRVVKTSLTKISACYTKARASNPSLGGTVQTQFFISPSGKVVSASASGVDPDLANCVAGVIKVLEFPKPKGGGGVQVNYPFTFRT